APSGPGDVTHVNARLGRKFGKIGNFIEISAQHTSNILAIGVKISRLTTVNDRNMRRIPVAINRSDLVSKLADKAGTTKTDADEERRVGRERRSRWGRQRGKNKENEAEKKECMLATS